MELSKRKEKSVEKVLWIRVAAKKVPPLIARPLSGG